MSHLTGGKLARANQRPFASLRQAQLILNEEGRNPVEKLLNMSSKLLRGVSQMCALNLGRDVPVCETPMKEAS